ICKWTKVKVAFLPHKMSSAGDEKKRRTEAPWKASHGFSKIPADVLRQILAFLESHTSLPLAALDRFMQGILPTSITHLAFPHWKPASRLFGYRYPAGDADVAAGRAILRAVQPRLKSLAIPGSGVRLDLFDTIVAMPQLVALTLRVHAG